MDEFLPRTNEQTSVLKIFTNRMEYFISSHNVYEMSAYTADPPKTRAYEYITKNQPQMTEKPTVETAQQFYTKFHFILFIKIYITKTTTIYVLHPEDGNCNICYSNR